jgi:MOSC domain-containing protein YiiM
MNVPTNSTAPSFLASLQLGTPRTVPTAGSEEWWDKEWTSGIFKEPFAGDVWLGHLGLKGDGVADLRVHGGVDKSVCAYPVEHYACWRDELGQPLLPVGAFGENFTTSGLMEDEVCVGDVFEIGEALVQVSQPREPCWKPSRRWKVKDLASRILQTGRTGFYFRTLRHGSVRAGQRFSLVRRPHPEWTVARSNRIMHHDKDDIAGAKALSECPPLAGNWKDTLYHRCRSHAEPTQRTL